MPTLSMFYGIIIRMQSEKAESIMFRISIACMAMMKLS